MSRNNKYDLPKVRLRFKTDPADLSSYSTQILNVSKYDAGPSAFLQRQKKGKQIHQAFMQYRKLKKNNYTKNIFNHKKSISFAQCKKSETVSVKNKNNHLQNRIEIALQSSFYNDCHEGDGQLIRRNKFRQILNCKKGAGQQLKQQVLISLKPQTVMLKINKSFTHNMRLYNSAVSGQKSHLELEGTRCPYETQEERRSRMIGLFKKQKKPMKATRGSSSFIIEAWKQEKMMGIPICYLNNSYNIDEV